MKINLGFEKEIVKGYKNGRLIKELATDFSCHHMTIRRHLKGKIKFRSWGGDVSKAKTKNWKFSKKQKDILEGLLLGDGCITGWKKRKRSKIFILANNSKEFCLYIKKLMPKEYSNLFRNSENSFHLTGKSCSFIKELYKKWYKNEKIVPRDFKLNKTNLYYWYLCDGSLRKQTGRKDSIYLYTDGLHLLYVKKLSKQLKKISFENTIIKHNYATKKEEYGFAIRISAYFTQKFLDFLGKNKIHDYAYKWNYKNISLKNKPRVILQRSIINYKAKSGERRKK